MMQAAFKEAKAHEPKADAPKGSGGGKEFVAAVNKALLYGGIMAHFVGDLSQPLHATTDYNGYGTGQGGSHAFFESDIVDSYDLTLDQEVLKATLNGHPARRLEKQLAKGQAKSALEDPLTYAWALTLDSYSRIAELNAIDKKSAVLKASSLDKGMKIKAERRPAAAVAATFRPLIVERLSVGADALATLWERAWETAGKPNLTAYQSWEYPTSPEFIPVDYTAGKTAAVTAKPAAAPVAP